MTLPIDPEIIAIAARAAGALAVGFVVGLVYFGALWRATERLVAGGSAVAIIALHLFRLLLIAAVLVASVWLGGAAALIAAALGITAARQLVSRRIGARP